MDNLRRGVLGWYAEHARELPWRDPAASAWGVLVSEIMLQQTPVSRVLPVWQAWLAEWPTPAALAAAPSGAAVRAWGRLGYPRRALRLHAAATAIVERYGGSVPQEYDELCRLPGVGDYTASAVASFAYGRRHAVLDTNVRRVLARAVSGKQWAPPSVTAAERALAESLVPSAEPATWAVAVMELGALVCTPTPRCSVCPIESLCAWRRAGFPAYVGPRPRVQTYAGTDRQCRGRLLAVVRESDGSVPRHRLDEIWPDAHQRQRALSGLVDDGLIVELPGSSYALPG
ncbi:MAG: A/G-specific adenine glycosylase [Actinomycetota bacterium]|nr:A/G-specific adenine glycosylase [Actinomycetota bacterium]